MLKCLIHRSIFCKHVYADARAHAITRAVTHIYLLTLTVIQSHTRTQTQEPGGRPLAQVATVPERPSRPLSLFIYYSNLEASSGLNGTIIKYTFKLRLLVVPMITRSSFSSHDFLDYWLR